MASYASLAQAIIDIGGRQHQLVISQPLPVSGDNDDIW